MDAILNRACNWAASHPWLIITASLVFIAIMDAPK